MFLSMMLGWYVASSLWFTVNLKKDFDEGNSNEQVYGRSQYFMLAANVLMVLSQVLGFSFLTGILYFLPLQIFMAYAIEKTGVKLSDWDIVFFMIGLYPIKVWIGGLIPQLPLSLPSFLQRFRLLITYIGAILQFFKQVVRLVFDAVSILLNQLLSQEVVSLISEQFYNLVLLMSMGLIGQALMAQSVYACISMVSFLALFMARRVGFGSGKLNESIDVLLRIGQVAILFSGMSLSVTGICLLGLNVFSVVGPKLTVYLVEPLAYLISNKWFDKIVSPIHRMAQTAFVKPVKLKVLKDDVHFWKESVVKGFLGIDDQGSMAQSKVRVGQYLYEQKSKHDIKVVLQGLKVLITQYVGETEDTVKQHKWLEVHDRIEEKVNTLNQFQQQHFAYILSQFVNLLEKNPSLMDELYAISAVCAAGILTNIENIVGTFTNSMMQSYVFGRQCQALDDSSYYELLLPHFGNSFFLGYTRGVSTAFKSLAQSLMSMNGDDSFEVHSTNIQKVITDPLASKSLIESDGTMSMLIDSNPILRIFNFTSLYYSLPIEDILLGSLKKYEQSKVKAGVFYSGELLQSNNTWSKIDERLVKIMQRHNKDFTLERLKELQWSLLEPSIDREEIEILLTSFDAFKTRCFEEEGLLKAFDTAVMSGAIKDVEQVYSKVLLPFVLLDLLDSGIMLRLGNGGDALSGPHEIKPTIVSSMKAFLYGAWLWLRVPLWVAKDSVTFVLSMIWEVGVSLIQNIKGEKRMNFSLVRACQNLIHHVALYLGMSALMTSDLLFGTLYCSGMTLKIGIQLAALAIFYALKLPAKMIEGFFLVNYELACGFSKVIRSVVFSNKSVGGKAPLMPGCDQDKGHFPNKTVR